MEETNNDDFKKIDSFTYKIIGFVTLFIVAAAVCSAFILATFRQSY